MLEFAQIIACGLVYFLVVYWFVIRREARPILPWAVCIIVQVVCFVFFQDIMAFGKSVLPGQLGMVLPSAFICVGNILLIIAMFGPVLTMLENKHKVEEREEKEFFVAPIPKALNNNAAQLNDSKNGGEGDITIDFIKKMIAEGRKDEALKYLKMLAYYSKDEQTRAEAAKLITELNSTRE